MNQDKMNEKLKKKGKIFQLIGVTKTNQQIFYVFATKKDAESFAEQQNFLAAYQIIDIEVWSMKK